ncbi:uncharacterized protein LOC133735931 [Rosa rugosa]|uniref:uncharacterized protein LOC133735931 n=1 Tax=Rosa rugosa TaxID=74645 RepID=UPI002B40DFA0|nr:uncharacterized protein LOC133735931 [Rosa rugosa]
MADKRLSFRFRFPWRNSPRSKEEPEPRPTPKTQNPAQSTTTVAPERPPFRPAGKTSVKGSPSQAQGPQKTDLPPSRAASESPKTQSPSRLSPSKNSHPTTQQSSPPSAASSQSQLLQEEAISQPQKPRRKIQIISETDSSAEDSTPRETTSHTRETSPKSIKVYASSDKSDSDTLIGDHKQLSESEAESKEHKEAEKVVQVPAVEEKTDDPGYTEPLQERVTQLPAAAKDSGNQAKDPLGDALQADQRKEKQEKVTELHAGATDPGNHTKDPLGVALQADQQHEKQERVAELHAAATDSGHHTKDQLGVASQADQQHEKQERVAELHTAATDSGNHTKDQLGAALQADQQQEKKENFDRKEMLATTSSDKKPIKTERSSSRVYIRKMVASTGERPPPNKEIREDVSKVDKLAIGQQMLDKPVGVVTLTGKNRGAVMLFSSEPEKREEPVHIRRGYKLNPDDNEATTDGEVSNEEEIFEDQIFEGDQQYINSNVQSINNSIVCSSSVTERNPGVAVFSSNPPESIDSNKESDSLQTHKAQVIQTPADKLTHESTVRRRCLGGLFMESSDSEPDNPAKPRRHGCRYICRKESKETEIGIV